MEMRVLAAGRRQRLKKTQPKGLQGSRRRARAAHRGRGRQPGAVPPPGQGRGDNTHGGSHPALSLRSQSCLHANPGEKPCEKQGHRSRVTSDSEATAVTCPREYERRTEIEGCTKDRRRAPVFGDLGGPDAPRPLADEGRRDPL